MSSLALTEQLKAERLLLRHFHEELRGLESLAVSGRPYLERTFRCERRDNTVRQANVGILANDIGKFANIR